MARIGFTGTLSVGKTTLVNALKELPEFKDYYFSTERSKYLRDLGIPLNTDSTVKGQMVFAAERASELIRENLITDRTIIDVMAFTKLAKSIPYFINEDFTKMYSHLIPEYDYIFYVLPDGVDIEDNGVRTTDSKYRDEINKEIEKLTIVYRNKMKHFAKLSGSTENRIAEIKRVIGL